MLQQKFSLLAVGAFAAMYSLPTAKAASPSPQSYGLFNTGINAAGMLGMESADPFYSVAYEPGTGSTPDPGTPLTGSTTYVTDLSNLPQYQPADNSTSQFITPYPTYSSLQSNLGGIYDFTTTFNLAGIAPSTVSLYGRFESDDRIQDILVNGKSTGIFLADPDYGAFSGYYNLSSYLVAGANTITFKVYNFTTGSNTDPVALRTEFSAAVPEPSVVAAIGLGALAGFGLWLRRRRATV